jgi:hypothetical protein
MHAMKVKIWFHYDHDNDLQTICGLWIWFADFQGNLPSIPKLVMHWSQSADNYKSLAAAVILWKCFHSIDMVFD